MSLSFILKSGKLLIAGTGQRNAHLVWFDVIPYEAPMLARSSIARAWGFCYLFVCNEVFPEPKIRRAVNNLHAFLVSITPNMLRRWSERRMIVENEQLDFKTSRFQSPVGSSHYVCLLHCRRLD